MHCYCGELNSQCEEKHKQQIQEYLGFAKEWDFEEEQLKLLEKVFKAWVHQKQEMKENVNLFIFLFLRIPPDHKLRPILSNFISECYMEDKDFLGTKLTKAHLKAVAKWDVGIFKDLKDMLDPSFQAPKNFLILT